MEETPLYNTRIIKSFDEYISKYHPQLDMMPILDYAGITIYQLEDEGHWLTQTQVDRFYEILVKTLGDPDLARKVGQFTSLSKAGGTLSQFTLGFMTPSAAYIALEKLYSHASRGSTIKTKRVSSKKVEVVAIQNPGVTEKPYQCENRLGTFEGIAKLFTNELARIEHTTCMHTSGDRCIYYITWKTTPSFIWKRIANYSYLLCLIICLFLFFALPGGYGALAIFSLILVVMGISLYQVHLEKDELATSFKNHYDTSSSLLDEINTRYNNAILVQEVGQAISMILDIDKLIGSIMELLEKHLDFDRGMIMLADREKTHLIYEAGFGDNSGMMGRSREIKFHIDKPDSKSIVIKTFREQKPYLVDDINKVEGDFSERSRDIVKQTGTSSFICVPIVFEKESLGVLMVDNISLKRALLESDMSLLMGIASQIAVSITNASYFLKMRESEERFRELAESLPETVYEADTKGTLTFVNRSAFDRFGYSPEDLARGLNLMDVVVPEEHGRVLENFQRIAVNGEYLGLHEYTLRRKDGSTFPGIINSTIVIHDGKSAGLRGFIVDITERKRAEDELKISYEQIRSLASRLQEVREETRTNLSHDLHDELGGALAGLKMDLIRLEPIVSGEEDREKRQAMLDIIHGSKELLNNTIRATRRIIMEQRPSVLDDFGLVAAMEWQLEEYKTHSDISFEFNAGQIKIDMDKIFATVVFRIFQEALANVIRHSKATEVSISIRVDEGQLILEVRDNGRGITQDEIIRKGSIGIMGMRERALAFGGEIDIAGESRKGTTLNLKIPMQ